MPTPTRNNLRAFPSVEPESLPPSPTWETHIVIPLVQNLAGGVAVFALCWIITVGLGHYLLWDLILRQLAFWSALLGAAVAAGMTIVRFFGDELGLLATAYRLGKRSADAQVNALIAENEQLHATARELRKTSTSHRAVAMTERINQTQTDAEHLLSLAYSGHSIAREKVSAYISQRPWERAIQLLRAAGCLDANGALTEPNLALSLQRLRTYTDANRTQAANPAWRPAWFVKAKH